MGIFSFLAPRASRQASVQPVRDQLVANQLQRGGVTLAMEQNGDVMNALVSVHAREFRASRLHWQHKFPHDSRLRNEAAFRGSCLELSMNIACGIHGAVIRQNVATPNILRFKCAAAMDVPDLPEGPEVMPMYVFTFTQAQSHHMDWDRFDGKYWNIAPDWVAGNVFAGAMSIESGKAGRVPMIPSAYTYV